MNRWSHCFGTVGRPQGGERGEGGGGGGGKGRTHGEEVVGLVGGMKDFHSSEAGSFPKLVASNLRPIWHE